MLAVTPGAARELDGVSVQALLAGDLRAPAVLDELQVMQGRLVGQPLAPAVFADHVTLSPLGHSCFPAHSFSSSRETA
jgi:hypothetical protein